MSQDWTSYVEHLGRDARAASAELARLSDGAKSAALRRVAAGLRGKRDKLIEANHADIAAAEQAGLARPLVERLKLDDKRIEVMAVGVEQIAAQVDPVGQTIEASYRPNGLRVEKRRVPLGVVLFFYESRPNVTSDAAALCLKSGNAVILRGGKEALHSNQALAKFVRAGLEKAKIDPAAVQMVEST